MPRISFLFWNAGKQRREDLVARMVREHDVDVLVLAENAMPDADLLSAIRHEMLGTDYRFSTYLAPRLRPKVDIVTRLPSNALAPIYDQAEGRLAIHRIRLPSAPDILLAGVHLPDKVNWKDGEQSAECQRIAGVLRAQERDLGCDRTVLVGDFNMNPFEDGMIGSHGMHGVMTRAVARKRRRRIQGVDYPFFYNPMWGCFGDRTAGPAGTHFFRRSTPNMYFWNLFDQVLFRPALLKAFRGELLILDSVAGDSLLDRQGRPDPQIGSDHLPLWFALHV